jgi:hypothetical protein
LTAVLTSCAHPTKYATFVTKTSLSVVDADTTPAGVSLGFDRVEGYFGPRLEDGCILPVVGYLETAGTLWNREIKQVYATGKAAVAVAEHTVSETFTPTLPTASTANKKKCESALAETESSSNGNATEVAPLYFATGTQVGFKIGFQQGTVTPNNVNFGYRRKEFSLLPVEKNAFPSVFASIDTRANALNNNGGKGDAGQFTLNQFFATGTAADTLARSSVGAAVKRRLDKVEQFRSNEAQQGKDALDTLYCLSKIPDNKLERVWNNAEDLGLFETGASIATLQNIRATTDQKIQRQIYTGDLGLINAESVEFGTRLQTHRDAVCRLAGSN